MELRHLRYFVALSEELSFTAAAKKLNLSQPPLSQQISDLEREIGARLFDRHSRAVKLTAAGAAFFRHAEALLAHSAIAKAEARAIGLGRVGLLQVGATNSVLLSGLSSRIAHFKKQNSEVEVRIHELPPQEQIDRLKAGRLDICFLRHAAAEAGLQLAPAWRERLGVVVSPGHRLARRKSISLQDLQREEFVFYRLADSAFARYLLHCCVEAGFSPLIVQEVAEAPTVVSLVMAGLGIGFVPESVGQQSGLPYIPLRGAKPNADVQVLTASDSTPLTLRFAEFAKRRDT